MSPSRQFCRYFQIGSLTISIRSKNKEILEIVGNWLANFGTADLNDDHAKIQLSIIGYENNERIPFILPEHAKLFYKNEWAKYYEYQGFWFIILQSATFIINRKANKVLAFAYYNDLREPIHIEDFMHPLVELLRQNEVYAHHAAAVSFEGNGLLLLGKSGQGKTTLSVDLLSHGFDFLADDRCFLREDKYGVEILGYYEPIRYFSENIAHINELKDTKKVRPLPKLDNGKEQLDLHPIYKKKIISKTRLTGIVFPFYSPHEKTSRIEPMPEYESLLSLLPLTMVCFDRTTSKNHFEFCVKLTTSLPAVKLIMGQDRNHWHHLVKEYVFTTLPDETKV